MKPANGASSPFSKLRIENASEICVSVQPVSSRIGVMNTPNPKSVIPSTRKLLAAPASAMYQP